jgi:hypothetical protein
LLQVHDELVFEVRQRDVAAVAALVRECMEGAVLLAVPLRVKLSAGPSWGSLTPLAETGHSGDREQVVVRGSQQQHVVGGSQPSVAPLLSFLPGGSRRHSAAVNLPPSQAGRADSVVEQPPLATAIARDLFGRD